MISGNSGDFVRLGRDFAEMLDAHGSKYWSQDCQSF